MITEEFIKSRPHALVDGIYLLSYPYSDCCVDDIFSCPYCGSPSTDTWDSRYGPGWWSYITYVCGVKAATASPALLAISRQNEVCRMFSQNSEADDVI